MAIEKKKISELPQAETLQGLYTIGCDAPGRTVKVNLGFINDAVQQTALAAASAESAANYAGSIANAKVDAIPGKGLSTNDYTNEDRAAVAAIPGKAEAEKTYSTVVNTPVWTKQPAIEGALDTAFVAYPEDYYFVTLKAADGTALPAGQFRLTPAVVASGNLPYNADPAKSIDQTFTLAGLDTGNSGVLKESAPVDFTAVGNEWRMRSGGVTMVMIDIEEQYKQGYDMSVYTYVKVCVKALVYSYFHPFLHTSEYLNYHSLTGVGEGYKPSSEGILFPPHKSSKALKHLFNIETCHLRLIPNCWQIEYARSILGYDGTLSVRTNVQNNAVEANRINGYCFSTNPATPIENLMFRNFGYSSGNGANPILNGSSLKITLKKRH